MKRLLVVLVPLVLFAQVQIDTIVRLPVEVGSAAFLQGLNKLYLTGQNPWQYLVLDCSTYELRAQIQVPLASFGHYSWNWRRQKLYITVNPSPESTLVIDAAGDSILGWLAVSREFHTDAYLSDIDVRFKPAVDTLYEYDCDTDTIIRRMLVHSTCASWDSVGRKLYVGQGSYKKLYVYDYLRDSCLKVIDVSAVDARMPDACVFSTTHRRAYVSPFNADLWSSNLGIVDTDRDTLVGVLPVVLSREVYRHVAVDERDGKVYVTSINGVGPDTMWVVDCTTDSVLKKFECVRRGDADQCIRWVPWSNRIYLVNIYPDTSHASSLVVIDCNTDSVIVPGMCFSSSFIQSIELDPVSERVFVTGVDSNYVYVLRDVEGGVVEEAVSTGSDLATGLQVQMTSGGFDLSYSIASPCRVDLSVYDLTGREVRRLVAEGQSAGEHRVLWNCADSVGNTVPPGVYLIRLDTPDFTDAKKAVVTR
jgi:hypothetical protein